MSSDAPSPLNYPKICDTNGECRATVSIVVPASKVDQTEPDLRMLVQRCAGMIEMRLGWREI